MNYGAQPGWIEVISGVMFSGKSEELIRRIRRATIARRRVQVFKSHLDSRYTGRDYDNAGETPDNDPSFYGIDAGYTAAANAYFRDMIGYQPDRQYVTIGGVRDWDWKLEGGRDTNAYLNVTPYLGRALRENSGLRIFVGQGWYDFATPFFAAEYALTRTGIPQDRITYSYYDSGHMMYIRDQDRSKLSEDVRAFIRGR